LEKKNIVEDVVATPKLREFAKENTDIIKNADVLELRNYIEKDT